MRVSSIFVSNSVLASSSSGIREGPFGRGVRNVFRLRFTKLVARHGDHGAP